MQFDSIAEIIISEASTSKATLHKRTKLPRTYKNVFGDDSDTIASELVMISDKKLISLEGAPKETKKGFYVSRNLLTDLKGAPQKVNYSFHCEDNEKLVTLDGGPQWVGKDFSCNGCVKLHSLKGAPRYVGHNFLAMNTGLQSLEGFPDYVEERFYCGGISIIQLAKYDVGNKVKGGILRYYGDTLMDKSQCTRAYYEAISHTELEDQQDITNI
jgi:hypothetical protein